MYNFAWVAIFLVFSAWGSIKYKIDDHECPVADEHNRYIRVPLFPDLNQMAKLENIPGLKLHEDLRERFKRHELNLYFEIVGKFDPHKPSIIMIPGGPGQDHLFIHQMEQALAGKNKFFESFNIIAMDHRGLGCSRPNFPGNEPPQALTMRYAAADIEFIRKSLGIEKINVMGVSYGSMLAQTYGLLFPGSVDRLMLTAAFSSHRDFVQAQVDYEDLIIRALGKNKYQYQQLLDFHNEYRLPFLKKTVPLMYSFKGRSKEISDLLDGLLRELDEGNYSSAQHKVSNKNEHIMPWMMRSISCLEIFTFEVPDGAVFMFEDFFTACSEFRNITDYFHYTDKLQHLDMPVLIFGGEWDHVTPAKAMRKMAKEIPNHYLYLDKDLGHSTREKIECFGNFMQSFFLGKSNSVLDTVAASKSCSEVPKIE
jgi:pimeloyl-ACP methyl ester carboxylesterase